MHRARVVVAAWRWPVFQGGSMELMWSYHGGAGHLLVSLVLPVRVSTADIGRTGTATARPSVAFKLQSHTQ